MACKAVQLCYPASGGTCSIWPTFSVGRWLQHSCQMQRCMLAVRPASVHAAPCQLALACILPRLEQLLTLLKGPARKSPPISDDTCILHMSWACLTLLPCLPEPLHIFNRCCRHKRIPIFICLPLKEASACGGYRLTWQPRRGRPPRPLRSRRRSETLRAWAASCRS